MLKIFLPIFYIFFCIGLRYFGIYIPNSSTKNGYITYKDECAKIFKQNIKKLLIKDNADHIEIEKTYKKPIGKIELENQMKFIDEDGNLFEDNERTHDLILIKGEYQRWPELYEQIQNWNFEDIVCVEIYFYRIDIHLKNNIVIQASHNLENIQKFRKEYPQMFKPNKIIDLRNSAKVGIGS